MDWETFYNGLISRQEEGTPSLCHAEEGAASGCGLGESLVFCEVGLGLKVRGGKVIPKLSWRGAVEWGE